MKVDKSNPRHWLYLLLFGLNTLIAIAVRPLTKSKRRKSRIRQIILYGHRLSGNLLALQRHINQHHSQKFHLTFLTMDPDYHQQLSSKGINSCLATSSSVIRLISLADAVISDHGLHSMLPLLWLSDVKFFDVWHGIPFKGFDESDFRVQQRYTETWVASPLMAEVYETKFGFAKETIHITGYARTDSLIIPQETDDQIRKRFGLQHVNNKRLVLFAPTWKQDSNNRAIFPFGISQETFLQSISSLCRKNDAVPIMRTHINARVSENALGNYVEFLPFDRFPDTEALLQITDILICDWSSIAFDFLLLDRPTIFLDVPPPFAKGLSLGEEFRFDHIVGSHKDLLQALGRALEVRADNGYGASEKKRLIAERVYANYADGHAAKRCSMRLQRHLINISASQ